MNEELFVTLQRAVLNGEADLARELTHRSLSEDVTAEQILDDCLVPAMTEAGRRFEVHEYFLPDLLISARAMKEALALLRPLLAKHHVDSKGRVVIGTVAGDLHDIGKNIVAAMLEGGGFDVVDLGYDVAPGMFANAVREHAPDIVAMSALLTTSVPVMGNVVDELKNSGLRDRVRVLAGGAPMTEAGAEAIGADAYAPTGPAAVQVASRLLSGEQISRDTRLKEHSANPPRISASLRGKKTTEVMSLGSSSPAATSDSVIPRELVKRAIEFQKPPRLPRQLWLLPWARNRYPEEVEQIEREFPQDIVTIPIFCSEPVPGQGNAHTVGKFVDAWGCEFENLQDGIIGEVKHPQITDWAQTEHVRFPRERLTIDMNQISGFCRETNQYVIAGTCPRPFERLQFLRGTEDLYLDLGRPTAAFRGFLARLHEFYVEELHLWASTDVDSLMFMDDWGSQQALLISPELWRELFKPLYADYVDIAHKHGKHAFMHSDGYIADIIPDLIEIGVDVLNSQVFCMDIEDLGEKFGGRLCFWGEMDRQQLLPRGTTDEVAEGARRLVNAFHHDGGFIAMCEFGPGARPENVREFFAVCAEV